MKKEMAFSNAINILKDVKKRNYWDVIKIIERLDDKPITFDFGAGNIIVIRYVIETIDSRMLLFVPAVKSFIKKCKEKKFFEIGSKRTYNYELAKRQTNEWIIYINRIKNLNMIDLTLRRRIEWQKHPKSKEIDFPFDERWLDKCLPIKNNLEGCSEFFSTLEDIDRDTLLSKPIKILRIQLNRQIEINEALGTVIKNLEYLALNQNNNIIKIYVPYFLKDLINNTIEKFLNYNLIINKLKVFYKSDRSETFMGFLWDPTLSGFITTPKLESEKLLSVKNGKPLFESPESRKDLEKLLMIFTETERNFEYYRMNTNILSDYNNDHYNYRNNYRDRGYGWRGRGRGWRGRGNYGRGRGSYGRGRGNYGRGRGNYSRGRGNYSRGRGNYSRGRGNYGRGRGNYSRGYRKYDVEGYFN